VREIMNHKNYKDVDEVNALSQSNSQTDPANPTTNSQSVSQTATKENIERLLLEEREKNKSKIPYMFTCCVDMPGKFLLSYMIKTRLRNEYIKLTHEGFQFRQKMFASFNELISWFKQHFMDPLPVRPQQPQQLPPSSHDRISSQMSNVSIQNYPHNANNNINPFDSIVSHSNSQNGSQQHRKYGDYDSRGPSRHQSMDYDGRGHRENGNTDNYRSDRRRDGHRSSQTSHHSRPLAASNTNESSSFNPQPTEPQRQRRSRFTDNTDIVPVGPFQILHLLPW
jgi:hypothetical protein